MKKVNLELNQQEAQVLVNLLNEALKAKGMEAESAVFFIKKIQGLFNVESPMEVVKSE